MKNKHQEKLFSIFTDRTNDFEKYEAIKEYINEIALDYICEQKALYYGLLTELTNSINNTGHEKRRSNDLSKINNAKLEIINFIQGNNKEEFLP